MLRLPALLSSLCMLHRAGSAGKWAPYGIACLTVLLLHAVQGLLRQQTRRCTRSLKSLSLLVFSHHVIIILIIIHLIVVVIFCYVISKIIMNITSLQSSLHLLCTSCRTLGWHLNPGAVQHYLASLSAFLYSYYDPIMYFVVLLLLLLLSLLFRLSFGLLSSLPHIRFVLHVLGVPQDLLMALVMQDLLRAMNLALYTFSHVSGIAESSDHHQ
jgi:hypothetical protein